MATKADRVLDELDDAEHSDVERATARVRRYCQKRVVEVDEAVVITLDDLDEAVDGERAHLEAAMVILLEQSRGTQHVSIRRCSGGDGVRWEVALDGE